MLIKDVVQDYKGRVEFKSENWGDSKLAERFGIKRYPVVFVNDVLVAKPDDFGGWGRPEGRYAPWRDPANHEKFKKDLSRVIDAVMREDRETAKKLGASPATNSDIAALPRFTMQDIQGRRVESANLTGQVVVVEFWATWCVPCRSTLGWLGEVKRRYGDQVTVLAIALDSKEPEVRQMTQGMNEAEHVVVGSDELAAPFGTITGVPTMFVFNQQGKTASVFYGAPEDLHQRVGRLLDSLCKVKPAK